MATLTRRTTAAAGTSAAMSAADVAGDAVAYANGQYLLAYNGDSASTTITLVSEYTAALGSTSADNAVIVSAGHLAVIPLPVVYKDSATSLVSWTYSSVTSLEVAVI